MTQNLLSAMMDHTKDGGTIPYKQRQSLSLFTGQPLDSTMTPQSIMAVQNVYASKQQPPPGNPPVKGNKRNTSKLGKIASNLQTPNQAAEASHADKA